MQAYEDCVVATVTTIPTKLCQPPFTRRTDVAAGNGGCGGTQDLLGDRNLLRR